MTSNAITNLPKVIISTESSPGKSEETLKLQERSWYMKELTLWFRPELLNRIDDIIIYHSLSEIGVQAIAGNELEKVKRRLLTQGIQIEFDPEVVEWIARIGYDQTYGARPLKRAINREILDSVALFVIESADEITKLTVRMKEGKLDVSGV